MFDANVQYAYVGTVRYCISPPAQLALPEMGGDTYPIEPGGVLDAVVAYDRAATGQITSLELHGASFLARRARAAGRRAAVGHRASRIRLTPDRPRWRLRCSPGDLHQLQCVEDGPLHR